MFRFGLDGAQNFVPLFEGKSLIVDVENGADAVFRDSFVQFCGIDVDVLVLAVDDRLDRQLGYLADFFFPRHLGEEFFDSGSGCAGGRSSRCHVGLQEGLAVHGARSEIGSATGGADFGRTCGTIYGTTCDERQTARSGEQHSNNDYVQGQTTLGHPNLPTGIIHARGSQFHARFHLGVRDCRTAVGRFRADEILAGARTPRGGIRYAFAILERFDLPAVLRATAWRTSAWKAVSLTFSPSWISIARRVLPSRLELKRRAGSFRDAPLAKVSLTTFL